MINLFDYLEHGNFFWSMKMKNRLVMAVVIATTMIPLSAFAEKGYYAIWSNSTSKGVENGPHPSLAACQEFLAKMQGKFNNMQNARCVYK